MNYLKNNFWRQTLLIVISLFCLATQQFAQSGVSPKFQKIQEWLDLGTSNGLDGISIYVNHPQLGEWVGVSGYADREKKTPVAANSIFYSASVSKTYAAVAMLKLVEQGKVKLDAKVSEFLPPEFIDRLENGKKVTIRQLMNMTAGWLSYSRDETLNDLYLSGNLRLDTLSHMEALERYFVDKKALFEPGTKYFYSSSNYLLLTMIMDKITGGKHANIIADFLKEEGYHSTFYKHEDMPMERLVKSYGDLDSDGKAEDISGMQWETTRWLQGDDGIMGTTQDIGRFMQDLLKGKLLSEASMKEMTQWVMPDDPDYGLGLMFDEEPLYGKVAGHSGTAIGASCDVYYSLEKDITIAFMVNTGKRNGASKFKEAYDYIFGKVVTELFSN